MSLFNLTIRYTKNILFNIFTKIEIRIFKKYQININVNVFICKDTQF